MRLSEKHTKIPGHFLFTITHADGAFDQSADFLWIYRTNCLFFKKNSPALCPEKEGHFLFCFLRSHTVSPARSTVGSRMRAGR